MKKLLLGSLILTFIMTGCVSRQPYTQTKTPAQSKEAQSLTVGAILPLSGDFAFLGNEVQRGIELARSELEKDGVSIEVIYEDDQTLNPKATANASNKLININRIDAGLTMLVEQTDAAAPIFDASQTPLLVVWDSNANIMSAGEYVFSTGFSTEKSGEHMATFAQKELSASRVAVLSHYDPFSQIITDAFVAKVKMLGMDIVFSETVAVDETDYRTVLTKIKQHNPDVIYAPLIPMVSVQFLNQAVELGLDAQILGADSYIQDVIDAAGPTAEDLYITNYFTEDKDEITQKYSDQFGELPPDAALVSFGYDGLLTLADAYERGGADVKKGLDDILGPSRVAERVERIYRVTNGQLTDVSF